MGISHSYPTSMGDFDQRNIMEYNIRDENNTLFWKGESKSRFSEQLAICLNKYAEICDKDKDKDLRFCGSTITVARYFDSEKRDCDFYLIRFSKSTDRGFNRVVSITACRKVGENPYPPQIDCYEKKSMRFQYASEDAIVFLKSKTF
jgi:hypothetical protein